MVVQWLRLRLAVRAVLGGKFDPSSGSWAPICLVTKKPGHENGVSAVANSMRALEMVHIKNLNKYVK